MEHVEIDKFNLDTFSIQTKQRVEDIKVFVCLGLWGWRLIQARLYE